VNAAPSVENCSVRGSAYFKFQDGCTSLVTTLAICEPITAVAAVRAATWAWLARRPGPVVRALAVLLVGSAELSFEAFIVYSSILGKIRGASAKMTRFRRELLSISGGISTSIVITIEITSLASA
jgi:hypothetical protein